MRRNGTCIFCYIKKLFMPKRIVTNIYDEEIYDNGVAKTPIMGWSSWNTFKNRIDQNLLLETAQAMKDKGLIEAGYRYVNLDDNWHSSMRDERGNLQGDLSKFCDGIPHLVKKLNELGLKVGIYSSNGTHTCEDLPASLGRERQDALTFAEWGIELLKYDYCHNIPLSKYAPLVYAISLMNNRTGEEKYYYAEQAKVFGNAKKMTSSRVPNGYYVSGLDNNGGAMLFEVLSDKEERYTLSVEIKKKGAYNKFLFALINDKQYEEIEIPPQKIFNNTARFQAKISLKEGVNTIKLFNPIANRADSAYIQYKRMGKMLQYAAEEVGKQTGIIKPIVYSICEWGFNRPWNWGKTAGNMWRTTMDIKPYWWRMMMIYERNVKLYKHSCKGNWNDPDMLEVGNGKLSYEQNRSHFSLWCMMAAPLILGNDVRKMPDNILELVTNKRMLEINQDELGKQAKRIVKGRVDVLAKPLSNNKFAVTLFNKSSREKNYTLPLRLLVSDTYVSLPTKSEYEVCDAWSGVQSKAQTAITAKIAPYGSVTYVIN